MQDIGIPAALHSDNAKELTHSTFSTVSYLQITDSIRTQYV
jgi:hypothetical protein